MLNSLTCIAAMTQVSFAYLSVYLEREDLSCTNLACDVIVIIIVIVVVVFVFKVTMITNISKCY